MIVQRRVRQFAALAVRVSQIARVLDIMKSVKSSYYVHYVLRILIPEDSIFGNHIHSA